jgi:hypothetical protein
VSHELHHDAVDNRIQLRLVSSLPLAIARAGLAASAARALLSAPRGAPARAERREVAGHELAFGLTCSPSGEGLALSFSRQDLCTSQSFVLTSLPGREPRHFLLRTASHLEAAFRSSQPRPAEFFARLSRHGEDLCLRRTSLTTTS